MRQSVTFDSYPLLRAACTRRSALLGLAAASVPIPLGASRAGSASCITVPELRQLEDPDDTQALIRALEAGGTAYCPAGQGSGPNGVYLLRSVPLRSGTTITGDGEQTVLRLAHGARTALSGISSTDAPLEGIVLRDLRIEGRVDETGFQEHWNLVWLSGVSGVIIERVQFVGFAGDGLYLGAEFAGVDREPRVIRDIVIRDCVFDGVNNDNRNAISVTGGSGITIDRCQFKRCTRPNMPGPIDFEPDEFPFYQLAGLRVTNCRFEDCGGNVGQIALVIPTIVAVPRNVQISGNSFKGYHGTGGDIVVDVHREPGPATPAMRCVIENNVGIGGYSGVQIFSGKGMIVRNNRWTGYASRSFLGFAGPTSGVLDMEMSGEQFTRCGWREGIALAFYKGEGVRLENIRFRGTGNSRPGSAVMYIGTGRIRHLTLLHNDWRDNPATLGLIIIERGADYRPGTARVEGNLLPEGWALPIL